MLLRSSVCQPKTLTKRAGGKGMGKDGEDGRRVSVRGSDRQGEKGKAWKGTGNAGAVRKGRSLQRDRLLLI